MQSLGSQSPSLYCSLFEKLKTITIQNLTLESYNLYFLNSVTCTCHKWIYSWNSISMFLRTGFLRVVTLQTIPRNPQYNSITLWSLIETSSKLLKATPLQIDFKHMEQNMFLCIWMPWTCPFWKFLNAKRFSQKKCAKSLFFSLLEKCFATCVWNQTKAVWNLHMSDVCHL